MTDGKRCILIADDEPRILRALSDFLSANNFHAEQAADGEQALEKFMELGVKTDIILLDVMMPKMDGFAVLREIRRSSLVPVIMLTARSEDYDQIIGFHNGADDYISKPFSPSVLLARIEAVLKRVGKTDSMEIKFKNLSINSLKRTVRANKNTVELTPKEFDLLLYFVINKEITLSREQLLNAVWGYEFEGGERTVDTHVKQLRMKLGECAGYIKTIHRIGYKLED